MRYSDLFLLIQSESTNETAVVKSKSYGIHGEQEILLWELTNLTTPEQVVWTEGQVRLQTHELEEFQIRFQISQHSSATGYFSLDEFLIIDTDKCDTQPPDAEPTAAAQGFFSPETGSRILRGFILTLEIFTPFRILLRLRER